MTDKIDTLNWRKLIKNSFITALYNNHNSFFAKVKLLKPNGNAFKMRLYLKRYFSQFLFEMRINCGILEIGQKNPFCLETIDEKKILFCRSFSHENSDNWSLLTTTNVCV